MARVGVGDGRMTYTSTVPAALTGLKTVLDAGTSADVKVVDGPAVSASGTTKAITIGFNATEPESPGVELVTDVEGAGISRQRETFTINSTIVVMNGAKNGLATARTDAYAILADVGAALTLDKTLAGSVMSARLGTHQLVQEQTPRGAVVRIVFGVDCDAFTVQ